MSETERDREIDAAWRAASTEEPSPARDAAIRAEARRAVEASPADARRRRRRQLRYPFAAAATVALLAFGIAQMVPPDEDASPPRPSAPSPPLAPNTAPASPPPVAAREDQALSGAAPEVQRAERALSASKQRSLAAAPVARGNVTEIDEVRAKQAGADSVEAWIARIRELKSNDRFDEATKELAKFRAAYGERADALLPPDLRAP